MTFLAHWSVNATDNLGRISCGELFKELKEVIQSEMLRLAFWRKSFSWKLCCVQISFKSSLPFFMEKNLKSSNSYVFEWKINMSCVWAWSNKNVLNEFLCSSERTRKGKGNNWITHLKIHAKPKLPPPSLWADVGVGEHVIEKDKISRFFSKCTQCQTLASHNNEE